MAGFEGFEKRLELQFSGDDPSGGGIGLRGLNFDSIEKILHAVQCTVVSAMGNHYFDSYVLSESSLFVYPTKIIIKTCGTTQLLKSIRPFITYANDHLGFNLSGCRYTRGSFIFPESQPYPHTSFEDEVMFIEECLPRHLVYKKAVVIPSCLPSVSWHVFAATDDDDHEIKSEFYTVEVCMVELDKVLARRFFITDETGGDMAGKEMTGVTGIGKINPNSFVSDFAFDPCGYSMNGMDVNRYSTVHVTPEEGYSYASFECNMLVHEGGSGDNIGRVLKRVAQVFRPGMLSVAVTGSGSKEMSGNMVTALKSLGLKRRCYASEEIPCGGKISFQVFTSYR